MILLRDVDQSDMWTLHEWRNRPEVARFMNSDHRISEDEHRRWFERAVEDPSRRDWIIELDGEGVGLASVVDIDLHNSRADWAFYLASEETRGRGVGSVVEYEILRYVFDELELHRLIGAVLATNVGVLAMHEKFGFSREGVLRQHVRKGDELVDLVLVGILRHEWLAVRDRIRERLAARGLLTVDLREQESARSLEE